MREAAPRIANALAALLIGLPFHGCALGAPPPPEPAPAEAEPGGQIIMPSAIIRTGARDAMEAIERANTHLVIARTRQGDPVKITQRGASSFFQSNHILLVVDGARVTYPEEMLRSIPAESIRYIQILTGQEAVMRWGSESSNGVIMVRTSAR